MRRGQAVAVLGILMGSVGCGPKEPARTAVADALAPRDAAVVRDAAEPLDVAMPPDWWARAYRLADEGKPDEAGTALLLALERERFPVPKAREAFHDARLAEVMKNPVVRSRLSRMGVRVPEVDANVGLLPPDAGLRRPR